MWRSLVWKEWREQRWKLAFGCALMMGFTFIGLRTRVMPDEVVVAFGIFISGLLLPLMVSMGLVAPERADGSLGRLLSLPVPARNILAAKAAVGLAVVAAPVLGSAFIALVMAGDREATRVELLGFYAIALGVACATFTWMTTMSIRQPSEARAGIVGIAVVAVWSMILMAGGLLHIDEWLAYASPFGFLGLRRALGSSTVWIVLVQIVIAAGLWAWAVRRLAKPGRGT